MQNLPRKFNPGLNQDDQSLIAQYVVRLPLLNMLLETIEDNTTSPICQHRLYYGPRGRGKTMLMARVAAELRVNSTFSEHWIPIRLLEESYYEISTIGEFWLEVMSELTLSVSAQYKPDAELTLKHLTANWSHPNLEQMAQAAVLELLEKLQKKAVIMIENLHQLIEETDDDFGWAIRRVMQNEPRIMFLVTATTRFDNLDNAKKPFFEIFATTELKRLKRSDATLLWNSLTNGDKTENEIAPLEILTGGSPRLLNIVAQFAKNNSIRELMENLTGLVDEYTEYFKSQLDTLAPKERRVFLALADLWSESSAKEISERARMDIRTTSALLGRLEHKGALKVDAEQPRRKMYSIAERLFCIYYKLRRERSQDAVIEGLVQFMVDFYTPEEIDGIRQLHLAKTSLVKEEHIFLEKLSIAAVSNDFTALGGVNEVRDISSIQNVDLTVISEKFAEANKAYDKAEFKKALAGYAALIERYQSREEAGIVEWVARSMVNQAWTYGRQGDVEKELVGYAALIKRYQSREEASIVKPVARAMGNQAWTYGQQGDVEKELTGYKYLIDHYLSREESSIVEEVTRAMVNQALAYSQQDQVEKALAHYETIISRYQSREEAGIVEQVTRAMINQAITYGQQGNVKKALVSYATIINRYQSRVEVSIVEQVAMAMINQAVTYGQQGDVEKALAGYAALIERFQPREEAVIVEWVLRAMVNQACAYGQQGDAEKALAGYANLIERYQLREEVGIVEQIVKAMVNQAVTYGQQGDVEKALTSYEALSDRYQSREEAGIVESVVVAITNQAVTYSQQGDMEKALAGYDTLIDRYQSREEANIVELVVGAMFNQSAIYYQQGNVEQTLVGYTALIDRYQSREETRIVEWVAISMINCANLRLIKTNWYQAEINYTDTLRFLENREFSDQGVLISTASLGLLLAKQENTLSDEQQSCLVEVMKEATNQPASEERMTIAIGIAAILPTKIALSIIQKSIGHEALQPLLVALQQEMGEKVRTSEEVLEVAADVRIRMQAMRERYCGSAALG